MSSKKTKTKVNVQVQSAIIVREVSEVVYDSKEWKPYTLKVVVKYKLAIITFV